MKAYIVSFYQQEISDNEFVKFLDAKDEILNWRKEIPNTVFVVSNKNAQYISELIRAEFPESLFVVTEFVPYNADGLLDEESWDFLNEPDEA